ncbi:MAG: FkbM family methyltransferase, partial [Helicobacter sp.]|nr:FkbM family methyltransferase [Helicobacter sp.]
LPYQETDCVQRGIAQSQQAYETEMLEDMLERTSENDWIFDVGMNIGNHTVCLAANGRKVCGFEANPKMMELAQINIALNHLQERVQLHCCGISDREERASFGAEIPSNFGAMRLQQTQDGEIMCHSLDSFDFPESIAMMKIDIEGMEDKALRGAKNLIKKHRPILYVEAQKHEEIREVDRLLVASKYVHCNVFGTSTTHLYIPREKASAQDLQRNLSIPVGNENELRRKTLFNFFTYQRRNDSIVSFGDKQRLGFLRFLPTYLVALLCARRYYWYWRNDIRMFVYCISFGLIKR